MKLLRILLLPFVIVGRLIFWFLLAIAALLLVRKLGKDRDEFMRQHQAQNPFRPSPGERPVETMVACDRCGVLLPESESIRDGDRHYCCEEHRKGR